MKFTRISISAAALAGLALAGPAHADDRVGGYVGIEAGVSMAPTERYTILPNSTVPSPNPAANSVSIKSKTGLDIAFIGGYDFGPIRAEVELSRRSNKVGRIDSTAALPTRFNTPPALPTTATGAFTATTGSIRTRAAMFNLIGDLPVTDSFELFAGGGIGIADVRGRSVSVSPTATFLNDTDKGFAWQLMSGARVPLGENVEISVKYKYFHTAGVHQVDTMNRLLESSRSSHSVLGGVALRF